MKKIVAMLCMVFAVCSAYAQMSDTLFIGSYPSQEEVVSHPQTEFVTKAELAELSALLTEFGQKLSESEAPIAEPITYPVTGKTKFARKHYIYQTAEISTIAGKDKDADDGDQDDYAAANDGSEGSSNSGDPQDIISNLNLGMNIGYSLVFVPGTINGDKLEANRFGFAYSTGFIAAFDRQDNYDVTCDFLWKIGVETGNGHAMGIGIDLMLGGGKTAGFLIDLDDASAEPYPYTLWCWKQGLQVKLRSDFLTTGIKNADVSAFVRFIHSINPQDDEDLLNDNLFNKWIEESWQFGVMISYHF